jgi:hypothetical protein
VRITGGGRRRIHRASLKLITARRQHDRRKVTMLLVEQFAAAALNVADNDYVMRHHAATPDIGATSRFHHTHGRASSERFLTARCVLYRTE